MNPDLMTINENTTRGLEMGFTARQAVQNSNNTVSNPAAVIVPAVISLITSVAGLASSNAMAKRQNRYNEEMINKQNEYNSPAAQMQRYREAGINPYLAMTSGGVSSGTQEQPQEKVAEPGLSGLKFDQLIPLLSLYSQMQVNKANIDKAEADSKLKTAQALTEETKRQYYLSTANKNNYWVEKYAPVQLESIQAATDLTREKIQYLGPEAISRINLNYVKADYEQAMIERCAELNKLTKAQTAECYKRCKVLQAECAAIYYDIAHTANQDEVLDLDKELKRKQMELIDAQAKLTGEKAMWYGTEASSRVFQGYTQGFSNIMDGVGNIIKMTF